MRLLDSVMKSSLQQPAGAKSTPHASELKSPSRNLRRSVSTKTSTAELWLDKTQLRCVTVHPRFGIPANRQQRRHPPKSGRAYNLSTTWNSPREYCYLAKSFASALPNPSCRHCVV